MCDKKRLRLQVKGKNCGKLKRKAIFEFTEGRLGGGASDSDWEEMQRRQ